MPKKKSINEETVQELIDTLNLTSSEALAAFISGKTEEERKDLLPCILDWIRSRNGRAWFGASTSEIRDELVLVIQSAIVGFFDMKTLRKESKKIPGRLLDFQNQDVLNLLRSRPRSFADEFILWTLTFLPGNRWTTYRYCFINDLCSRVLEETVVLKMLENMSRPDWQTEDDGLSAIQIWLKYPELLEQEFWYIFEHEFSKPFGFTFHDSGLSPHQPWTNAILELLDRKLVQRERLLEVTIGTLAFSYPENEMRWYANLHRKLQPSHEEIKQREEKYLGLIEHRNPCAIALGFEMLVQLDKAGQLDDRLFLQRIGPIFNEKPKSRSKTAVVILDRIAKHDKSLRNEVVSVALSALSHEAVDVQTAAAKLILQHIDSFDSETVSQIQNILPSLHGSVQTILAKLAADTECHTPSAPLLGIVPRRFGPLDVNRLESLPKLKPVETVDELIDLAAKVLVKPSDINEIEMLVDGIMRLHHLRDIDFVRKTSALRKSVLEGKLFRWAQNNYLFGKYFACIVSVWLADSATLNPETRSVKFQIGERTNSFMASNRLFAETYFGNLQVGYAERIAHGIVLQPLSTPTHHGGWIDPKILVDRIKHDPHELKQHDTLDKVLSLYRIAPDHCDEARQSLGDHLPDDSYVNALRAILGDETITVTEPHYFIAVQARRQVLEHKPIFRVDLSTNSISDMQLALPDRVADKSLVPLYGIAVVFGLLPHYENTWVRAMLQWRGNLCPAIRDPFYWDSHSILLLEIDDKYDYPGPDAFLEPLCDPNEPVTEAAATALLAALVVKPDSLATLGQDILIASIGDGRLDAVTLSNAAAYWVRNNLPKRNRWIKRFQLAALQSPGHTNVIRITLENIVSMLDTKEAAGFLELLNECCVTTNKPVSDTGCRTFLESFSGSGKAAKLAKKLLEL